MTTVDRKALTRAFKIVAPAVAKSSSVPQLFGTHLVADDGSLRLTASNLDFTIATTIDCTGDDFDVIASGATLGRLLTAGRGNDAEVTVDGDVLHICAGIEADMRLIAGTFPSVEHLADDAMEVEFAAEDMESIVRVLHAVSLDTARTMLSTVHINGTHAEATDSYRLARCDLSVDVPDVMVPLDVMRSVIEHAVAPVGFVTDGKRAAFTSGPTTWTTALTLGDFPDTQRLLDSIEPRLTNAATVDATDVVDLLDRLKVLGPIGPQSPAVISVQGDTLVGAREVKDVGHLSDTVPADGTMDAIALRPDFLADAIEHARIDSVTIRSGAPRRSVWIESPGYVAVVMPVGGAS